MLSLRNKKEGTEDTRTEAGDEGCSIELSWRVDRGRPLQGLVNQDKVFACNEMLPEGVGREVTCSD